MSTVMTPDELRRYADAVIDTCLHIRKGDVVAIHGEPGARPYVQALVEAAYASGARYVDVLYVDPVIRRARITGARDVQSLKWSLRWHLTRMKDLIAAERRYPDRVGETYQIAYNPEHEWYYFPMMLRDEAIVFKVYDSKIGRAHV